jgi:hypothetical protein
MGKTQKKMAFSSSYLAVGPDRAVDVVVLTIPEDLAHRADLGGAVALLAPVYTYCNNADDDDAIILCARAQLIVLSGSGGVVPADSLSGNVSPTMSTFSCRTGSFSIKSITLSSPSAATIFVALNPA